jgi:formylglycine-generating enzyme
MRIAIIMGSLALLGCSETKEIAAEDGSGGAAGRAAGGAGGSQAGGGAGDSGGAAGSGNAGGAGGAAGEAGAAGRGNVGGTGGIEARCTTGQERCAGGMAQTCDANGDWQDEEACEFVCADGDCVGICSPGSQECDGDRVNLCNASGEWELASTCPYVCTAGACDGVCVPDTQRCERQMAQSCNALGQWETNETCTYTCSSGACTGECAPGSKRCSGNLLQTCQSNFLWNGGSECSGVTPVCSGASCTTASGAPPSCATLSATCGLSGAGDCCASIPVPGGTFNRRNDAQLPAMVSDFSLDAYEVTVGRFRQFVSVYSRDIIGLGAGKNPNNPDDTGWEMTWSSNLPADAATLRNLVKCGSFYTWTDSPAAQEHLPMNCMTWYEAYAFCIWDGGRLPTEAEWNYAAAGGEEQRIYPWGSTPLGPNADIANYGCYYNGTGTCTGVNNFAPVGSIPAGQGKWGHLDLAGNVWEWTQDWYAPFQVPCRDCAILTPAASERTGRGGGLNYPANNLYTTVRAYTDPMFRPASGGVRCAR